MLTSTLFQVLLSTYFAPVLVAAGGRREALLGIVLIGDRFICRSAEKCLEEQSHFLVNNLIFRRLRQLGESCWFSAHFGRKGYIAISLACPTVPRKRSGNGVCHCRESARQLKQQGLRRVQSILPRCDSDSHGRDVGQVAGREPTEINRCAEFGRVLKRICQLERTAVTESVIVGSAIKGSAAISRQAGGGITPLETAPVGQSGLGPVAG
jgi:hypothetical protein